MDVLEQMSKALLAQELNWLTEDNTLNLHLFGTRCTYKATGVWSPKDKVRITARDKKNQYVEQITKHENAPWH